ncbi:MAG: hypothetical protein EZS28_011295 [Streblomastix strix]|uniref:Reverse transcriptase domain-containing protein n=1 Tax=Streblomastix strix TaxID=222440 RepID=A0A5J4WF67_9EUKA|nr:MAG: hypothetical protein EZS28_011295 [Streblomastix strix]
MWRRRRSRKRRGIVMNEIHFMELGPEHLNVIPVNQEVAVLPWNLTFIRPKLNGKFRKIINYRRINNATNGINYKMEVVKDIMDLLEVKDYATILDLEGAQYHIRVEKKLSRYFGNEFRNRNYLQRGFLFGYIQSPSIFCRFLRIVINSIREKLNIKIIMYKDDLLLIGKNMQKLKQDTVQAAEMLTKLGWRILEIKSQTNTKINFEFLYWIIDTQNFNVRIPVKIWKEIQKNMSCWIRWMQ